MEEQSIEERLFHFSSVQFSCSVVSNSLQPHGTQHTRPPGPSPTHEVYSNSCLLSQWCHPTISSSVVLSSCPQSFPASESFLISQLFASGGQNIGASASVLGDFNSPVPWVLPERAKPPETALGKRCRGWQLSGYQAQKWEIRRYRGIWVEH